MQEKIEIRRNTSIEGGEKYMSEQQADKIIELLEAILDKLDEIKQDTDWTQHYASQIASNTSD